MHIEVQDNTWKRLRGAMFRSSLRDHILVFPYAHPARRLFHTFFCPPLQIVGLDGEGNVCFSRDVGAHTFTWLPPAHYVLETDPNVPPDRAAAVVRARYPDLAVLVPRRAALDQESDIDPELQQEIQEAWDLPLSDDPLHYGAFVAVANALKELRSVAERLRDHGRTMEGILQEFPPGKRGTVFVAALDVIGIARLIDVLNLGKQAPWARYVGDKRPIAEQIDTTIRKLWYPDEVYAAGIADLDWPVRRKPSAICMRCQEKNCTWSTVLEPAPTVPEEERWRYDRPENHVPLCYYCSKRRLTWSANRQLRIDVARLVWGARFKALLRWHEAAENDAVPDSWDKRAYPLWPASYGGDTWQTGSGACEHVEVYSPNHIPRTPAQREALATYLGISPDELPRPLVSFPPTVADFWKDVPDDA